MTKLQQCVLAESVYNTLAMHGDATVFSLVNTLRARWQPAWGKVEEVVTVESVAEVVDLLRTGGFVDNTLERLAARRGMPVKTDYDKAELVWNRGQQ